MANPLFDAIMGRGVQPKQQPARQQFQPSQPAPQAPQMTMQDAMHQLQSDTAGTIRQAGYNIPDEYATDARSAAMYLIQSGQVANPIMRRVQPMLNFLMGGRK